MWRYRTKPKTLSLSKAMFFSNTLLYCSNAMEAPFLPSLLLQPDIKKEQRALHSLSWETQQSSAVRLGPRQPQKITWEAVTELYAQNKTFSTSLHCFRLAVTGDYPDQDMGCLKALPNTACLFWLARSSLCKKIKLLTAKHGFRLLLDTNNNQSIPPPALSSFPITTGLMSICWFTFRADFTLQTRGQ